LEQIYKIISFVIIRFKFTVDEQHNPETCFYNKLLYCSVVLSCFNDFDFDA